VKDREAVSILLSRNLVAGFNNFGVVGRMSTSFQAGVWFMIAPHRSLLGRQAKSARHVDAPIFGRQAAAANKEKPRASGAEGDKYEE
jgi:hypothetical protein